MELTIRIDPDHAWRMDRIVAELAERGLRGTQVFRSRLVVAGEAPDHVDDGAFAVPGVASVRPVGAPLRTAA